MHLTDLDRGMFVNLLKVFHIFIGKVIKFLTM